MKNQHYRDLCKEFLQALTRHSSKDERRLIIFIDALDQLLEDVFWVPTVLPRVGGCFGGVGGCVSGVGEVIGWVKDVGVLASLVFG